MHEAAMYERNSFVTLTYSDEHLKSPKLVYKDFQDFMKRLRRLQNDPIGVFVTGEYGEKTKRPHWHALLFNWRPSDETLFRTNDRGDRIFKSATLERLWVFGHSEIGAVTFESAGYCARYAAKKLCHGHDDTHEFHPISKKSSKHAIGKRWLEKNWEDIFNHGRLIHQGKDIGSIPRYYEKWLKQHKPQEWLRYVSRVKLEKTAFLNQKSEATKEKWLKHNHERRDAGMDQSLTDDQTREIIQEIKFKQLQDHLKL